MAGGRRRQKAGGEAPCNQCGNDEQAPVQAYVDSKDAAEAQVFAHVTFKDARSGVRMHLSDDWLTVQSFDRRCGAPRRTRLGWSQAISNTRSARHDLVAHAIKGFEYP